MKVGIDISQMAFPGTGVGIYTRNLVTSLLKTNNDLVLFGASLRKQKEFKVFPQTKVFPIPPTLLEILWNQLHTLPVESLIGKVDVFHSSDWTQPPTTAKKITTIHDLVVYKYPQSSHPKIVAAQKRRLEWVKKEVDAVIAISQSTKKDIVKTLNIPQEKIKVIYEATTMKKGQVKKSERPYILAVGTREPRKNLGRLIQAYQLLKTKDVDLVIAGKYGWGEKEETVNGVKLLGYVPNDQLADLYTNAAVFVYPSLYEGFGIPILEAFNCDCPVITSNVSSMPEVGGDAAIYIDPLDANDLAEKIETVLEMNKSKKDALIKKGRGQASKFSWEETARQTAKAYETLS
ncbi:glycosyltransferase family 4 protein [Patescibacteria group bacterium]|nr:glycosyltransferase family 4 protein [Patescibacteria group bacterium]